MQKWNYLNMGWSTQDVNNSICNVDRLDHPHSSENFRCFFGGTIYGCSKKFGGHKAWADRLNHII